MPPPQPLTFSGILFLFPYVLLPPTFSSTQEHAAISFSQLSSLPQPPLSPSSSKSQLFSGTLQLLSQNHQRSISDLSMQFLSPDSSWTYCNQVFHQQLPRLLLVKLPVVSSLLNPTTTSPLETHLTFGSIWEGQTLHPSRNMLFFFLVSMTSKYMRATNSSPVALPV